MKRLYLATLVASLTFCSAHAATIGINFGTATVESEFWNNVPDTSGEIPNLMYLDGSNSGIVFDISDELLFNGTNTAGVMDPGEPAALYFPGDVTNSSFYGNTAVWGGTINDVIEFSLSNLTPGTAYQSTFYAIRTGAGDNRDTEYDVAGATRETVYLDAAGNGAGDGGMIAQTNFIEADSNGEITYTMQPGPDNDNGNGFFYLSGLFIEEGTGGTKPGDFNGDSRVDADDFEIMLSNFHTQNASFADGDFNLDRQITLHDYAALRLLLEDGAAGAANQSVPEPTSLFIILLGLSTISLTRSRRAAK